ncbi:MAG: glycosyltransferase family 4 protein [Parvularculaceae bacterium]|nr:glycosyltransferase family 4 protein [Parvularculaceae bacterium]
MRLEKTVLQVIPALHSGGAERTTVEMTKAIIAAGGRAIVATSGGRLTADVAASGGRVMLLPVHSKNPLAIYRNAGRLERLIRDERVDIIHARSRAPAWSALIAARRTRVPLVTTYHGAYRSQSRLKRLFNSSMARGDLVIANSEFTAAAIRQAYDVGDRLRVIPRGADLAEFNPSAISADRIHAIREQWGLVENSGALVLLLPGRLTDWKGHWVAVEAFSRLIEKAEAGAASDLRLIFAGDQQGAGDYAASLAGRVGELGLQRMIRFVGHCGDMPAAYGASDIVLSPSIRPEAFGRVAAEAGAMGKPVIASDHGGARETIVDEDTGLLVSPGSADDLFAAIRRLIDIGAEGRRAMGARARARIALHFATEAMTEATIAAYHEVLSRKGKLQ